MELLPDWVQGWYLLNDAHLTVTERNMIQTAVQGDYRLQTIAQELRNQWSEEDIRRRDAGSRHTSFVADEEPIDEGDDEDTQNILVAWDDLTPEGQAMLSTAEDEAQEALLAMDNAKRTLRAARQRQHQVKLSRRYYKSEQVTTKPDDSKMQCLRCGRIGHRAANCPQKPGGSEPSKASMAEAAPFVCYVDEGGDSESALMAKATPEVVRAGMCVIDGGATRTIGSVHAIQQVLDLNQQKTGVTRLKAVDTENRPIFGFGNSTMDMCASTIKVGITAGDREGALDIHSLDRGQGPVLLSIASLRSLGAIIDFEKDLSVFRNLDPTRIIRAERSATGHQLLPLSQDWYSKAEAAKSAVPSLEDYVV